jgi:hypothetical protein
MIYVERDEMNEFIAAPCFYVERDEMNEFIAAPCFMSGCFHFARTGRSLSEGTIEE